jgi:hypothetical protein
LRDRVAAIAVLLCTLTLPRVAGAAVTFRSAEFCFEARFSSQPDEQDEDRVTKQKVRIRGRRFLAKGQMQAELITAVKFQASLIPDEKAAMYFDATMDASAKAVKGDVSNVSETRFQGLPARTFDVAWRSSNIDWQSRNIIVYTHGYSWVITAIYKTGMRRPQAFNILKNTRVDAGCAQRPD